MDNTLFSLLTLNPQPLHIDAHFSATTEFGQRLFNSLYTLGIMIGMTAYDVERSLGHDARRDRGGRAWAEKVVAAFAANPHHGTLRLDDKLIDKPHLTAAKKILGL